MRNSTVGTMYRQVFFLRCRCDRGVFPNATCATALIDRLVHHADVLSIEGESYRRREAESDTKSRRKKAAT